MFEFHRKIHIGILLFLLLLASDYNITYAEEDERVDIQERRMQEVLDIPLGYYERKVSIRRPMKEEFVIAPTEGLRLTHHVGVTVSEIYDDNIYNDPDNEIDDFITRISPDLRLDISTNKLYINSIYKMSVEQYWDLSDEWPSYSAGVKATYQISTRVKFDIQDIYSKSSSLKEIEGVDLRPTGHTIERTDSNDFFAEGKYDLMRGGNTLWVKYANATNGVRNHGRDRNLHSTNQKIATGFTHSFTRRSSISPGYTFHKYNNRKDELSSYDAHGVSVGLNHTLANVLKGQGEFGLECRDYTDRNKEEEVFNANVELTSIFSRITTIKADYKFDTLSSYISTDEYDQHTLGIGIEHYFTPLISVNVSTTYKIEDYLSGKEADDLGIGAVLDFKMGQRLTTSLSYKLVKYHSTTDTDDYLDNVYMISVKTLFW